MSKRAVSPVTTAERRAVIRAAVTTAFSLSMTEDSKDQQLSAPYDYLEQIPGKDMRTRHITAFNSVIGAPQTVVDSVIKLVQKLHNVSLLLDDIEDGAVLRRGKPVAHSIFGVPRTINSANFVMLEALQEATQQFGPDILPFLYSELLALHRGQGLDLYWRDVHVCPTEDEYMDMVLNKTAGLYRLAVKLLQHFGSTRVDLVPLANLLGVIYQIQDDYLNLESSLYTKNKGFCEDLTEGKFSFPVVHCLRQEAGLSSRLELDNILRQHTSDVELKQHALNILHETGSLQYSLDAIFKHVEWAQQEIASLKLKDPAPLYMLLDQLVLVTPSS